MKRPDITSGPWTAKEIQGNASILRRHYRLAPGAGNMPLAYMPVCLLAKGDPQANARAIAAVPDLLDALETAMSIIEDLPYPDNRHANKIRAALTKAGYQF